jgi:pimeloyl-ACP methyl ester carboxylesterase
VAAHGASPPPVYRPLHVERLGAGRSVVILHGVGFGPWSVTAAAESVARGASACVVHRAGYGESHAVPVARSVDEQVDDLLRTVNRLGGDRVVIAGFAGGATIALAAAIRAPERFRGLVLHEPALGPRAAGVHALLEGLAGRVAPLAPPDALAEVVSAMLGTGSAPPLPDQAMEDAKAISVEVAAFARFVALDGDLLALRSLPVVTTVGANSPPARHQAAGVLAGAAGASVVVIPGSAHLVQLDAPDAFAAEVMAMAGAT